MLSHCYNNGVDELKFGLKFSVQRYRFDGTSIVAPGLLLMKLSIEVLVALLVKRRLWEAATTTI